MARYVIVHGAWGGGWSWNGPVAARLRAAGHEALTPTLTGLGERSHLANPAIDLDTHVQDVVNVLEYEDLRDVVLAGHSYGGMVITGVADRTRDRLRHLVYFDAFVPEHGQSLFDLVGPDGAVRMRVQAAAEGEGWRVPPGPLAPDTPPELIDWITPRRGRQPIRTFEQPLRLAGPPPDLPRTYVYCAEGRGRPVRPVRPADPGRSGLALPPARDRPQPAVLGDRADHPALARPGVEPSRAAAGGASRVRVSEPRPDSRYDAPAAAARAPADRPGRPPARPIGRARAMWNSFRTDGHQGTVAGITTYAGGDGDLIHAYVARPEGDGPFPGVVLVHHMPGWDEFYQEFARRLANHNHTVICPDLYCRLGHGTPDDVAAAVRAQGGVADDSVVADCQAALGWLKALPTSNGKVGIIGTCSGGRHAVLVAGRVRGFDAVADLWGGGVVMSSDQLTPKRPVAPIDYTKDLSAPLLGLFGNEDQNPPPDQVDQHEAELKRHDKEYAFHRYDGAGHGFFYYDRPAYRQQPAMDGWSKVFAFFDTHLKQ